jgi:phosphoserine phosphatase
LKYLFVDLDKTFIQCTSFTRELKFLISEKGIIRAAALIMRSFDNSRLSIKQLVDGQNYELDYSTCVNKEVLALTETYKARGYTVILATAAMNRSANSAIRGFDCFDEILSSSNEVNLKGSNKLAAIESRIGKDSFIYIGDSRNDFVIFEASVRCVLISTSPYLRFIARVRFGNKVQIIRGQRCQHVRRF